MSLNNGLIALRKKTSAFIHLEYYRSGTIRQLPILQPPVRNFNQQLSVVGQTNLAAPKIHAKTLTCSLTVN